MFDLSKTTGGQPSDHSSDEETGDKETNERDLDPASEEEEDTADQDDLLVLKKRHVNFDPGALPNEVSPELILITFPKII